MNDINTAILIGNLTRDPEFRTTQSGIPSCKFTIAVNGFKSSDGVQHTDYITIQTWRNLADFCGKYLEKGTKVAVNGSITTRSYEKDGRKVYVTEIRADQVQKLSPRKAENVGVVEQATGESIDTGYVEVDESELPF